MKMTRIVLGLAFAAALAVACSSSSSAPTTVAIAGSCALTGPVSLPTISVSGPCDLGPAGQFTLNAGLTIHNIGACGDTPVAITATLTQSTSTVNSTFAGGADVPCYSDGGINLTVPILIGGTFTYDGGTGTYADATGSAVADGGVTLSATSVAAELSLNGSLTY